MKAPLRRVGNSLGIIIPRSILQSWNVREGDALHLSPDGIFPPNRAPAHEVLDTQKHRLAAAVAARFSPREIRAHSLANLHRWRASGVWVTAYDEWKKILESDQDGELFAAMLGRDERATRLRQSAPYVGMLPRDEVRRINEEAAR
jgi:antitoxin component of MazEF toxin-antitoxin module